MNAGEAVRAALAAAIAAKPSTAATIETRAATLPRLTIDDPLASDWGTKTERGRELRTLVTVRVAEGQRARLDAIVSDVEAAGAGLSGAINGWRVASAVLVRTRVTRERGEVRAAAVEHRVRVMEI